MLAYSRSEKHAGHERDAWQPAAKRARCDGTDASVVAKEEISASPLARNYGDLLELL